MGYIEDQAEGWIDIGRFHHEYDRNPTHLRPETADGPGATAESTDRLRKWLEAMLRRHDVLTMLDAACGDWNWMRLVDFGRIEYNGWDVDPGRIETCSRRIINGDFVSVDRPNAVFEAVNLLTVPDVGYYDLVMCRDFLMHVTNEHVSAVLDKIKRGGSLLLLATTFPGADNDARQWRADEATWAGYMEQAVDLSAAPFNLGPPIETFAEEPGPWGILAVPRELSLWKINEL